jgi:hypothetical protein
VSDPTDLASLARLIAVTATSDCLDARLELTQVLVTQVAVLPPLEVALLVQHLAYITGTLGAAHPANVRRALLGTPEIGDLP